MNGWVVAVDSGDKLIEHLDGLSWVNAPPPPQRHEHWAQTRARVNGKPVQRCPCGAISGAEGSPWDLLDPPRILPPAHEHEFYSSDFAPFLNIELAHCACGFTERRSSFTGEPQDVPPEEWAARVARKPQDGAPRCEPQETAWPRPKPEYLIPDGLLMVIFFACLATAVGITVAGIVGILP